MVKTYELYVESGPKRRKTMVHVPQLLGCVATGPTTEAALEATPDAIRQYLRFLQRHGESAKLETEFETAVVQHVTEGDWLGNGSPYLVFDWDLQPATEDDVESALKHFAWVRHDFASWVQKQSGDALEAAPPEHGRSARAVLLHVLGASGYLSASLGGLKGYSTIHTQAERGTLPLDAALLARRREARRRCSRGHAGTTGGDHQAPERHADAA